MKKKNSIYLVLFFIGICLVLSSLFFPNGYLPFLYFISDLGNPFLNPIGYIFFKIGTLGGFFLIPYFFYIYQRLKQEILSKLTFFFESIACICFIYIGIYPFGIIHNILAIITFAGFGLSIGLTMKYLIKQYKQKGKFYKISFLSYWSLIIVSIPISFFSLIIYEWIIFIIISLWFFFIFPHNKKRKK